MFYPILLTIGLLASYGIYYYKQDKNSFKENGWVPIVIGMLITLCTLGITKLVIDSSYGSESEYRGTLVLKAEYYEYWSSWVEQTCSRQVYDGEDCVSDGKGGQNCTPRYRTEYYDCSYCDENEEYWTVKDNLGRTYQISESKYKELMAQWGATPKFVDQNRRIRKSGRCGVDGDMYDGYWDKQIMTSEATNHRVSYINKGKFKNSGFSFQELDTFEKNNNLIYEYPDYYYNNYSKQRNILGIEKLNLTSTQLDTIYKHYEYMNGLGYNTHCKVFILLFPNKNISNAQIQERYWQGGHRNEMVICIGYDSTSKKLDWVYPFSWTNNKRVGVDLREDIMEMDTLNLISAFPIIYKIIDEQFEPKNIDEFSYVANEYSIMTYIILWILAGLIPIGTIIIYIKIQQANN